MPREDDDAVDAVDVDATTSSAPDLQFLGDEVTLQPSGYVEPQGNPGREKEEALMNQFASFRAEPLQYAHHAPPP